MQQDAVQNRRNIRVPDLPAEVYKDQAQRIDGSPSTHSSFLSTTERIINPKEVCDPSYIRSTMYTSPASEFALESCALPFAIIATPFSTKGAVQLTSGFDTCVGCRSYFNHFTQRQQNAVICNICGQKTTEPLNYPENLALGSFEYVLSPTVSGKHSSTPQLNQQTDFDYPPLKTLLTPTFAFIFDLSSPQLVHLILDTILEVVEDENFQILYQNVGFFVINNGITTFTVSGNRPVKHIMPGEQPFISNKCAVPTKNIDVICTIIDEIRKIGERAPPNAVTILNTIQNISSFTSGCKIALVTPSLVDINYELLLNASKNCSVNLLRMYADKNALLKEHPTLERLAFYSSGVVYRYTPSDLSFLRKDIRNLCLSRSVFDVKIIMKVSDNLSKTSFIGPTLEDSLASAHLNCMCPTSTVQFNLGLSGASKEAKYIQMNVAFTDFDGSRRMRVFNMSFSVGIPTYVFSAMSFDTLFAALIKQNVSEDTNIQKMLVDSLVYYRSRCSTNASATQFVLPESIKCLPVLIQSYFKKTSIEKSKLINASVEQNLRYFYPRLFSLSDFVMSPSLEQTKNLRLGVNSLTEDDIYILEDSEKIMIYVPRGVDKRLRDNLFEMVDGVALIRQSDEEECAILNRIIYDLETHYGYEMNVMVCLAGEHVSEAELLLNMIEDKVNNQVDYVDYIFKLHFDVQKS